MAGAGNAGTGACEMIQPNSLCLNMIVRSEESTIKRLLDSVKDHVTSWCIVDTGSTDRTKEIIRETLAGIPGELHERPWVNFGHNRTEALELAKKRGDAEWILFMDADHELEVEKWPLLGLDGADHYYVQLKNGDTEYDLIRIVNASLPWRFDGSTHETIACSEPVVPGELKSIRIIDHPDGTRRRGGKFEDDVRFLLSDLEKNPNNTRAMFYLAQSYKDSAMPLVERLNQLEKQIEESGETAELLAETKRVNSEIEATLEKAFGWYVKRINAVGGFREELFWSFMNVATIQDTQGDYIKAVQNYHSAYELSPWRNEALWALSRFYFDHRYYSVADLYAEKAAAIPRPKDRLFVNPDSYGEGAKRELARMRAAADEAMKQAAAA